MQTKDMLKIVITGHEGFIGKNLSAHLKQLSNVQLIGIARHDSIEACREKLSGADIVFHLAGVNRPELEEEFLEINTSFTAELITIMEQQERFYKFVYASSTQVTLDNQYGKSKLAAEIHIQQSIKNGSAFVYRLPGVFGKWCRPNYNSVVATFCHNIALGLPIAINNEEYVLSLIYIDDVIDLMKASIEREAKKGSISFELLSPTYEITLGELAKKIQRFKESRNTYFLPLVADELEKKLYSTYLTYLPTTDFAYNPILRSDERGSLFELVKSLSAGQFFVSYTKPGITRGNHFHHTKTEKFCVVAGEATIGFRKIEGDGEVITYEVSGKAPQIVDIPPGYTHNITNIGETELITLFWANEIFDQQKPDTYFLAV